MLASYKRYHYLTCIRVETQVVTSSEHGNESVGSTEHREFFE